MKLVIDIDDSLYESIHKDFIINSSVRSGKTFLQTICKAILFGKPLPKNHGRLIDADALEKEMIIAEGKAEGGCDYYMEDVIGSAKEYIIDAETIIPATKEGDGE